jgi:long-chain acyl-CoA synthetase
MTHGNIPGNVRLGSVGKAVINIEAKLAEDGFYYIVDRKKHIIITAGGKNLSPANIENEIKPQDSLISQVHVHGDKRPYVTAIVTIAALEAIVYAQRNSLIPDGLDAEAMLAQIVEDPLAIPTNLDQVMAAVTAHKRGREIQWAVRSYL